MLGMPFLWFQGTFMGFLKALAGTWVCYILLGAICYRRAKSAATAEPLPSNDSLPGPKPTTDSWPKLSGLMRLAGWFMLAVSLAVAMAPAYDWVRSTHLRKSIALLGPAFLIAQFAAVWVLRRLVGPLFRFNADDDCPAPTIWSALAIAFILFQAVTATIYIRHSRDDGYYFAAVLDYEYAPVLNDQEPTHREGAPVVTIHRTLAWELWGAVVCYFTGLTPMGLFRTLLPGSLILMAYAAYASVLSTFLPRRWMPIALIGLSAIHLWGIANNETAINFLLPRPWQSKTVLTHIGVPMVTFLLIRFMNRPSIGLWLSLLACIVFGVTICLSAIFMFAILIVCLALAFVRKAWSRPVATTAGVLGVLMPLVLVGIIIWVSLSSTHLREAIAAGAERYPHLQTWQNRINYYLRAGSAEAVWVFSLPLLSALLVDRWRKTYLIGFSVVMALTFANPFLYVPVSRYITSYYTYDRMWWMFPVGPGLGVLFALVVRLVCRNLGRPPGVVLPLLVAAAGLGLSWCMPGVYVWARSNTFWGDHGYLTPAMPSMQTPRLAENFEKIPAGLAPLAEFLTTDPEISETRILCNEPIATFLTCYSRKFRFVQTRPGYTEAVMGALGKPIDYERRHLLVVGLLSGKKGARAMVRPYLIQFKVKYAITGPGDLADDFLIANGYEVLERHDGFALWRIRPLAYNPRAPSQ
jgi:hypothetical protein